VKLSIPETKRKKHIEGEGRSMNINFPDLMQLFVSGIAMGSIYSLMAIGYTITFNALRIINFAQGDMLMLGAAFGYSLFVSYRLPYGASFVLSILSVALIGIFIERVFFKTIKRYSTQNLIIASVGISTIIRAMALLIWGTQALNFPSVFSDKPISLFGAMVMPDYFLIFGIAIVSIVLLQVFFTYTNTGKAMRACAQNRDVAMLVGINTNIMDPLAMALSAGMGAIGGILVAPIFFVQTEMGALAGMKGFAAAVLGGFGSIPGAIVGGLLLGVIENFSASYISSTFRDAFAFIVLIGVLFVKPTGILGSKKTGGGR